MPHCHSESPEILSWLNGTHSQHKMLRERERLSHPADILAADGEEAWVDTVWDHVNLLRSNTIAANQVVPRRLRDGDHPPRDANAPPGCPIEHPAVACRMCFGVVQVAHVMDRHHRWRVTQWDHMGRARREPREGVAASPTKGVRGSTVVGMQARHIPRPAEDPAEGTAR
ncbi:MAG: hypothetical protein KatS3mg059_0806 [Thermomicrobiales bacterium]|nr:MAG: hypothetical protein KatS3mg059_0806 [Thermomicrobiales bacterium]